MKKIIIRLFLVLICSMSLINADAQSARAPIEEVVNAIRFNRVGDMVKYFDNFVPITINNNQSIYSHNQAELVLKDFFDKNNPKDFVVTDNGSPSNTAKFIIGYFDTPNGVKYNVYILLKLKDNNFYLQEIRLNKE